MSHLHKKVLALAPVLGNAHCDSGASQATTPDGQPGENVERTPEPVSVLFQMNAVRAGAIWSYFRLRPKYALPRGTRDIMVLVELAMRPNITVGQLHLELAQRGLSVPIPSLYQIMNRFVATDHVRCEIMEDEAGKRLQAFTITQIGCCAVAYYEAIARSNANPAQAFVSLKNITEMEETSTAQRA